MAHGTAHREVHEKIEAARMEGVNRIAEALGLDPDTPAVRVGLRGWVGFLHAAVTTWLTDKEPSREALIEMSRATLAAIASEIATATNQG